MKKTTVELKTELHRLELQNDTLQSKLRGIIQKQELLEKRLNKEQNRQEDLSNSVDILNQNNIHSSTLSKIGAIILLLGLFIEVIGATLMAGADLSNEIEFIRDTQIRYTSGDLAIEDKVRSNVMTFYGILGSVLLVVGFCFQFTGTIIILGLPWYVVVAFIFIAIASSFSFIRFLAKQNVNQPIQKKIKVFFYNVKRLLVFPIKQRLAGKEKIVCEVCQKTMLYSEAEIWYKQETNSEQYPYLYPPYGFYLGHAVCLKEIYPEKENTSAFFMTPHPLYKKHAPDFYNNYVDDLYKWNQERLKDLQRKRNSTKDIVDETEVSLRNIKKLLANKKVTQ